MNKFSSLYAVPNRNGVYVTTENHGFGTSIINMGELFGNDFISHGEGEKVNLGDNEESESLLEDGDLLFARRSLVESGAGKCSIVLNRTEELTFESSVIRIRLDKSKANPLFYYYWFKSNTGKRAMRTLVTGSNVKGIKGSELGSLEVPELQISEQNRIVKILFDIDSKISNNIAICSDLETMAKLMYDYWFVQFDFPDENGKPYKSSGGKMVWNEELKRELPEGWKVVSFGDCITSINTGLNPRDNFKLNIGGNIKYITVKNLTTEGIIDFTTCDTIDEEARTFVHRRSDIQVGDILFASISPLGRCYIITDKPDDWDINESVFSVRPNYKNMTSTFLYMTFMSKAFIKAAEGSSAGSVFKGIRIAELQGIKTIRPPKSILDKFDAQVKKIFTMKANTFNENQELASLRDFLLPMLMNGQVKVGKAGT